jgi:predicted nucleic acid-binding protein
MLISEISINDLKQYANVYHDEDDNLFAAILAAGKQFISTYTGLPLELRIQQTGLQKVWIPTKI